MNNQKNILKNISTKHFVHISTIDVYDDKLEANEKSLVNVKKLDNYGYNRYQFEEFVKNNFNKYHIIRLPMLFGKGLKKNILYDLLNDQYGNINGASVLQWYSVKTFGKTL